MDAVKNWFTALSRREQILVGVAGILLLICVLVFGVIRPLWLGSFAAKESYQQQAYAAAELDARYALLQSATDAPAAAGAETGAVPAGSLIQQLTTDAAARSITLSANNPSAEGGASIAIDSINPNSFFTWVIALEKQGVTLASLSMQPIAAQGGTPGLVFVRADFVRLGSN